MRMIGLASESAQRAPSLTLLEMAELTRSQIEETFKLADQIRPSVSTSVADFHRQVRILESSVVSAYAIAVYLARRTTDLRELCDLWKTTSEICAAILTALKTLKDSYPQCGTPELYDLALDYKNAAFKRYQANLEALRWENTEIPAGLLPKSA